MGMARLVSLGIVIALIACLGITFYQVIAPFLMPLFLAGMVALLCQPVLQYFLKRCHGRRPLAAGLSTAAIVGSVMLPIVVTVLLGILQFLTVRDTATDAGARVVGSELREMQARLGKAADIAYDWVFPFEQVSALDRQIFGEAEAEQLAAAEQKAEGDAPRPLQMARRRWLLEQFEQARGQSVEIMKSLALKTAGVLGSTVSSALDRTVDVLGACVGAMVALFVFTLALYYFLLDGPDMVAAGQSLIPVEASYQRELMTQFARSVRAVVLATFLAAVGQGISTAIALQIAGMGHFFLFAIIATFAALIPMAGTWLVWMPCVLWLGGVEGSWGSAAFLAVMGIGPIGMMDNVVRTWVLKNDTSLHPLLAFVSVLGGLQVMGLWGVFIGPIVACCLHSLIEILNLQLRDADFEQFRTTMTGDDSAVGKSPVPAEPSDSEVEGRPAVGSPVPAAEPSAGSQPEPPGGQPGTSESTERPAPTGTDAEKQTGEMSASRTSVSNADPSRPEPSAGGTPVDG